MSTLELDGSPESGRPNLCVARDGDSFRPFSLVPVSPRYLGIPSFLSPSCSSSSSSSSSPFFSFCCLPGGFPFFSGAAAAKHQVRLEFGEVYKVRSQAFHLGVGYKRPEEKKVEKGETYQASSNFIDLFKSGAKVDDRVEQTVSNSSENRQIRSIASVLGFKHRRTTTAKQSSHESKALGCCLFDVSVDCDKRADCNTLNKSTTDNDVYNGKTICHDDGNLWLGFSSSALDSPCSLFSADTVGCRQDVSHSLSYSPPVPRPINPPSLSFCPWTMCCKRGLASPTVIPTSVTTKAFGRRPQRKGGWVTFYKRGVLASTSLLQWRVQSRHEFYRHLREVVENDNSTKCTNNVVTKPDAITITSSNSTTSATTTTPTAAKTFGTQNRSTLPIKAAHSIGASPSPPSVLHLFVLLHGMSPPAVSVDTTEHWSSLIDKILSSFPPDTHCTQCSATPTSVSSATTLAAGTTSAAITRTTAATTTSSFTTTAVPAATGTVTKPITSAHATTAAGAAAAT